MNSDFLTLAELGYDSRNLFKDESEAGILNQLNEIQRETILGERIEKAHAAEYKFRKLGEV